MEIIATTTMTLRELVNQDRESEAICKNCIYYDYKKSSCVRYPPKWDGDETNYCAVDDNEFCGEGIFKVRM